MIDGTVFSLSGNSEFACLSCCECGIQFLVPRAYRSSVRSSKQVWYCPNGHGQSYSRSELDIFREESVKNLADKDRIIKEKEASIDQLMKLTKKKK